jgi:hypothetical protein
LRPPIERCGRATCKFGEDRFAYQFGVANGVGKE